MKKQPPHKLVLDRETLATLNARVLDNVGGGVARPPNGTTMAPGCSVINCPDRSW